MSDVWLKVRHFAHRVLCKIAHSYSICSFTYTDSSCILLDLVVFYLDLANLARFFLDLARFSWIYQDVAGLSSNMLRSTKKIRFVRSKYGFIWSY